MRNSFSHNNWKILVLVLAFSSLAVVTLAEEKKNPLTQLDSKDLPSFKELQDIMMPLIFASAGSDSCMSFVFDLYSKPEKYIEPFIASGKGLNDYGDQFACRRLKNFTYLMFVLKLTAGTNRAIMGVCAPSQCKPQQFEPHKPAVKSAIANATGLDLTAFDVLVIDPQVEEDKIDAETDIYSYLAYLLMGSIIVLGTLGSIYDVQEQNYARQPHSPQKIKAAPTSLEFSEVSNFTARSNASSVDTEEGDVSSTATTQIGEKLPMGEVLLSEKKPHSGKPRLTFVNLCKCFSFYTNGKKLFSTNKITDNNASTECLNGFRIFTMFWVILGHTYYYHLRAPIINLKEWHDFIVSFRNQPLVAAPLAVDSFLYLGGFLGAYLMLKELRKRKGRLNVIQVWVHRFYRIVPLYLLIVLFGWKIMPGFVVGVGGYNFKELMDYDCHDTWWWNLVFLNNYFPSGKTASCFGYSWYLAVDMQCFLPLPILLILYYKNRKVGWIATLTLFFGSILLWFAFAAANHWSTDLAWIMDNMTEYFDFYSKPYFRFGPYGLGIITGLILSEYQDERLDYNTFAKKLHRIWSRRLYRYITYIIGVKILLWSIFIHYPVNNGDAEKWSQFTKSLFLASQRSIWVFGWTLIFLPAMMGWGSALRAVLGASFWSPLVRLTFGAYLIHPILQVWYYWNVEQGWLIGHLDTFINCTGFITASYILAACFSLMAEAPAMNLEKYWMPHKRSSEEAKA